MQEPVTDAKGAGVLPRLIESGDRACHPAALNFGDCFAHEAASERAFPLLYVGDDP